MANRVLVIYCPKCKRDTGAYDPSRSEPEYMGVAIRHAAANNLAVEFRESPCDLKLGCACKKDEKK